MTPRPIHKWKTFWLGLFILTSLAWAWASSISHYSYLSIRIGPLTWHGISSAEGQVSYTAATHKSTRYFEPSRTVFGSRPTPHRQKPIWFPAPLKISHVTNSIADQYRCDIAYWPIILIFLISWSSLLLWRRRKPKPLTAPKPPPQTAHAP